MQDLSAEELALLSTVVDGLARICVEAWRVHVILEEARGQA